MLRRTRGYWDNAILFVYGHERMLFYELKSLGVDSQTINIGYNKFAELEISFQWKNPSNNSSVNRKVTFLNGNIDNYLLDKSKIPDHWNKADFFIMKSIPIIEASDSFLLNGIPLFLKKGGTLLLGASGEVTRPENIRLNELKNILAQGFIYRPYENTDLEIAVSESNMNLTLYTLNQVDWIYGWKLHAFKNK